MKVLFLNIAIILFLNLNFLIFSKDFPVPIVENEFNELIKTIDKEINAINFKTKIKFLKYTAPYAPYDLLITNTFKPEEKAKLKNMFFGFISVKFNIGIKEVKKTCDDLLSNSYYSFWKRELTKNLSEIILIKNNIENKNKIIILSHWVEKDEFRINNYFSFNNKKYIAVPTEIGGFIPSLKKEIAANDYFEKELQVNETEIKQLLDSLKEINILAYVRVNDKIIKFICAGVSDNEIGLMFINDKKDLPQIDSYDDGGKQYIMIEKIKENIYIYKTS